IYPPSALKCESYRHFLASCNPIPSLVLTRRKDPILKLLQYLGLWRAIYLPTSVILNSEGRA
ncbi:hypothetical protein, partial [Vibrio sp. 1249-1]|uniref:hypothetical protein n=1 Tax=Vibrio sp. 1249-1 TaxID=3074547 RepID=UPI0029650CF9